MTLLEIVPIIVTVIEMVKRFIPDEHRVWANPLIALFLGLGMSYAQGGIENLATGLGAASTAVATYKVPKMIGNTILKEDKQPI